MFRQIVFRPVGQIAIGSLVKVSNRRELYQVDERENGYTRLRQFFDFVVKVPFEPVTITIHDSEIVWLMEGF